MTCGVDKELRLLSPLIPLVSGLSQHHVSVALTERLTRQGVLGSVKSCTHTNGLVGQLGLTFLCCLKVLKVLKEWRSSSFVSSVWLSG